MGNLRQKSLKINYIMNIFLTMSSFIFPMITFPYVSRVLLPTGTGKVAFATSLIAYFNIFAQLGIPTYGVRTCAKVRDDRKKLTKVAHELLIINLIMNLLSYLVLAILLIKIPKLSEERNLYIIISCTIFLTSIGMEWIYKALEQYTYITVRSLIAKIISLIFMFLLVHEQKDYIIYGGITILASSASNIFNFINVHKYIDLKPLKKYDLKKHIKPIFVFFGMACATTIYTNLDTVMLGFMCTNEDVGYYNAAIRIKTILVSIVTSLGTVLLPRSSYYVENNMMDRFWEISKKALNFVIIIAAPMMVYFIIYAKYGIYFLSGDAYYSSIIPMRIIMPTLILIGITNILGIQVLVPLGREKSVLVSVVMGAIINLAINSLLIVRFASVGAAIGTLVAELVVLIIQYRALKDQMRDAFKEIKYWKIIVSIIISVIVSYWITYLNVNVFFILLFTSISFFVSYFFLLFILKEKMIIEVICSISKKKTIRRNKIC